MKAPGRPDPALCRARSSLNCALEPLHHRRDQRGTCGEMVEDPALGDAGLARRGLEGEVGHTVAKNDLLRAEQDPFAGVLCSCH